MGTYNVWLIFGSLYRQVKIENNIVQEDPSRAPSRMYQDTLFSLEQTMKYKKNVCLKDADIQLMIMNPLQILRTKK